MMTRLSAGNVPVWQLLLAVGILVICSIWVIKSISRLFQAQYLLSGKEFKLKTFINILVGRS
jgi:hypothetical protein